jgi:hypothetical protein
VAFSQKDPHSISICKGTNGRIILITYFIGAYSYVEINMNNINNVFGVVLTSAHWVMAAHWPVDRCTPSLFCMTGVQSFFMSSMREYQGFNLVNMIATRVFCPESESARPSEQEAECTILLIHNL